VEDKEYNWIAAIANLALEELQRATSLHGPMRSGHEGIAVIEEEFLELRSEVFLKHPNKKHMR
jgi:hypothetical protein